MQEFEFLRITLLMMPQDSAIYLALVLLAILILALVVGKRRALKLPILPLPILYWPPGSDSSPYDALEGQLLPLGFQPLGLVDASTYGFLEQEKKVFSHENNWIFAEISGHPMTGKPGVSFLTLVLVPGQGEKGAIVRGFERYPSLHLVSPFLQESWEPYLEPPDLLGRHRDSVREVVEKESWQVVSLTWGRYLSFLSRCKQSLLSVVEKEHLRALMPRTAADFLWLAILLMKQKRYHEAEEYFQQALSLLPDNPETQHAFGAYLVKAGRVAEGMIRLSQSLTLEPFSSRVYVDAASTQMLQGRWQEAQTVLEEGAGRNFRDPLLLFLLAQAYWKGKDRGKAREMIRQALQIAPGVKILTTFQERIAGKG